MERPDYKTNDPRGWCGDPSRGAALGRPTIHADNPESITGRLYLRKVRLDSGGYDTNGTYFGHGASLYWVANAEGTVDFMLRARNRKAARFVVLARYPNAKVRR